MLTELHSSRFRSCRLMTRNKTVDQVESMQSTSITKQISFPLSHTHILSLSFILVPLTLRRFALLSSPPIHPHFFSSCFPSSLSSSIRLQLFFSLLLQSHCVLLVRLAQSSAPPPLPVLYLSRNRFVLLHASPLIGSPLTVACAVL